MLLYRQVIEEAVYGLFPAGVEDGIIFEDRKFGRSPDPSDGLQSPNTAVNPKMTLAT